MKILVIGGSGFIGSFLGQELVRQGHNVTVLDLHKSHHLNTLRGDVRDRDLILSTDRNFDIVYYLAGYTSDVFKNDPQNGILLETLGVSNILNAARISGLKRFIYVSSFHVYSGLDSSQIVREETSLLSQKLSVFGASKLLIERLVALKCQQIGIDWVNIRLDSVFGAHPRCTSAIYYFLKQGLQKLPIELWGSGNRANQFSYIQDITIGLVKCLQTEHNTLNLCSPERITIHEIANLLDKKYGLVFVYNTKVEEKATMPFVDSLRARNSLDWVCTPLEVAIDQVWKFMLANRDKFTSDPL